MPRSGRSPADLLLLPLLLVVGAVLWTIHAHAWDLGNRSPILNYDTAQYALAARELFWHGRFATPFAVPLELALHARPPWPLGGLAPGLVVVEAAIFQAALRVGLVTASEPRAWLTLILPFCTYLFLGTSFALGTLHLFRRWWPDGPPALARMAALVVGMMFLLDPESQHYATGGFAELPFTLGLLAVVLGLALGSAERSGLALGITLGVALLFRADIMGLVPLLLVAAGVAAPPGRRLRVMALVLAGWAIPSAPWWLYKWRAFGVPGFNLSRWALWDHVQGRTWFSLYHLPEIPRVPSGFAGARLLAAKAARNAPGLALGMLTGPRGLWIGALAAWLAVRRRPRALVASAIAVTGATLLGLAAAALHMPLLREFYSARVLLEAGGALAFAALIWEQPAARLGPRVRGGLLLAAAALAIGWGALSSVRGDAEARAASLERGVPSSPTLTALSILLNRRLTPGEPVMSNLGPALAWQTNHPVIHLALSPDDVEACRRRLDFRHVLLVFRDSRRAWGTWSTIVERPGEAATHALLGVQRERRYRTEDGFVVVWLELAPLAPELALAWPPGDRRNAEAAGPGGPAASR